MNEEIDNSSIADLNELSNVKGKLLTWKKCLIWTSVASLIFILGLIVGLVAHPKSGLTVEWVDNVIEVSIRLTFLRRFDSYGPIDCDHFRTDHLSKIRAYVCLLAESCSWPPLRAL